MEERPRDASFLSHPLGGTWG